MTTREASLVHPLGRQIEDRIRKASTHANSEPHAWNADGFATEQIRSLVQQVFVPGWPKPARQVVFSSVEEDGDSAAICLRVAQELASEVSGQVCIVETDRRNQGSQVYGGSPVEAGSVGGRPGGFRQSSHQISGNLWFVPADVFMRNEGEGLAASWLSSRLAQLRLDFEYAILHAAPAGSYSEAALLGSLTDGIVLVLQANRTRKPVAQEAKERISAANARLIGTVLSERTFPIPEGIYRKL